MLEGTISHPQNGHRSRFTRVSIRQKPQKTCPQGRRQCAPTMTWEHCQQKYLAGSLDGDLVSCKVSCLSHCIPAAFQATTHSLQRCVDAGVTTGMLTFSRSAPAVATPACPCMGTGHSCRAGGRRAGEACVWAGAAEVSSCAVSPYSHQGSSTWLHQVPLGVPAEAECAIT